MNEKRISVRFNLDEGTDREAWEYLNSVPHGSRTNTILVALLRNKHDDYGKDELKALIKNTIQEALIGHAVCAVPASSPSSDGIPADVLAFMKGL